METKILYEIEAVIFTKSELTECQRAVFKKYKNVETFSRELFKRSEYSDDIRKLKDGELCLIGKKRVNGARTKVDILVEKLCEYWGIDYLMLLRKRRFREIVEKRQVLQYVVKKAVEKCLIPFMTLEQIGELTNSDHSTIVHSVRVVENRLETDKLFPYEMNEIWNYIMELYGKL